MNSERYFVNPNTCEAVNSEIFMSPETFLSVYSRIRIEYRQERLHNSRLEVISVQIILFMFLQSICLQLLSPLEVFAVF